MSIRHEIRHRGGGTVVRELTPLLAIRLNCAECVGWDRESQVGCTSRLCALWPFRLGDGHSGKVGVSKVKGLSKKGSGKADSLQIIGDQG